ncbi:MAG: hypothetical protein EBV86_03895 [Marivivens sp.]|nr:hypothetical protein [Marivivens sp.]
MARIRQQYPQNYGSSGNINTEFENLIRYLNSAELGNKTVGELLAKLFDDNGVWNGPVEFRKDSSAGLQYRIGEYTSAEEGWKTIIANSELRGESGSNAGEIGAPIFFGLASYTATAGQTIVEYAHEETDELLVFVNGLLKREGATHDYTTSDTAGVAGQVTFTSGLSLNDEVTIYKVRATAITGYLRSDIDTVSSQSVFPFTFDENYKLLVYKNGILQREGGSNDYTEQPANNTITFNTPVVSGNVISILTVENTSVQAVTGLMFEDNFVHADTGLIKFDKISIANGDITQAKVADLTTDLTSKAKLTVSSTTPTSPVTGDLWHDTSQTPNQLKFYDGTQFLRTSPDSSLPTFTTSNSGQFVKVNQTGTALEYGTVDLTGYLATTQRGAANGVASLDSTGKLPNSQLPAVLATMSMYQSISSPAAQNYRIQRIYRQKIRIDGFSGQLASGTCDVQITVDGTAYGSVYNISSSTNEAVLASPIEINATTLSHEIGFVVTNIASPSDLEVTLAVSVIGD